MHLNLNDTITAAGFTAAALDIEAESSFLVAPRLRILRRSKQIPDLIKHTCIRCRIGTGRSSNGRLVNIDHLVKLFHSFDFFVLSGNCPGMVQLPLERFVKHFVCQ